MLTGSSGRVPGGDGASLADRAAAKYFGVRTPEGVTVALEDDAGSVLALAARLDLRKHSPAGFEWGYAGSGPAQLALAVLADAAGATRAAPLYQAFKAQVVAAMQGDRWELTRAEVLRWVENAEKPGDPS